MTMIQTTDTVPTSVIVRDLLKDAPGERVTFEWLLGNLGERSFGIMLLFLGMIGLVPAVGMVAVLLLFIPAAQMVVGRRAPVLPEFVGRRRVPHNSIAWLLQRVAPSLAWIERFTHPRWLTPSKTTQAAIGLLVILLAITALSPIPFAGVMPNLVVMLLALALLEQDGMLLALGLLLALVSLAITGATVWATLVVPRLL